jgi:Gram-negative bacterial TonB protein C-terminal
MGVRSRASNLSSFLVVTAVVALLNLQPMTARPANFDNFGDALARQIADAKIHTLAVAEFVTSEGANSPRGKYLAALLCESWLRHHPELVIVKPASFDHTLAAQKLSLQDLKTPEPLKQIGKALGVEAVVLGSLTDTANGFLLAVTVRKVADGALVLTREQPLAHSQVLDSLAATEADTTASAPSAGVQGVGIPVCTYQPTPVFPFEARKAKVSSATAVLVAVITLEGRATNIRVIKDPGYGFAERAVERLTEWRCKLARDKDKKPVAVTIPIEIAFRD